MSAVEKNRNLYIDAAKVIGIVLVVMGHSFGAGLFAAKFYHMPLFFIISGLTLKVTREKSFLDFMIRKVKRLYFPFLAYETVFLLLNPLLVKLQVVSMKLSSISDYLKGFTHIILFDNYNVLLSPLWFMTALFFSINNAFLIVKIVCINLCLRISKKKRNSAGYEGNLENNSALGSIICFLIAIVLIYSGLLFGRSDLLLVNSSYAFVQAVNVILEATGYILIGFGIKNLAIKINYTFAGSLVMILFGFMLVFERVTRCKADMRANEYEYILFQPAFAIIGSIFVFIVSKLLIDTINKYECDRLKAMLCFVSDHTISIMCLHYAVFKLIGCIQVYLFHYDASGLTDWQIVDRSVPGLGLITVMGFVLPLVGSLIFGRITERIKNT